MRLKRLSTEKALPSLRSTSTKPAKSGKPGLRRTFRRRSHPTWHQRSSWWLADHQKVNLWWHTESEHDSVKALLRQLAKRFREHDEDNPIPSAFHLCARACSAGARGSQRRDLVTRQALTPARGFDAEGESKQACKKVVGQLTNLQQGDGS